MLYITIVLYQRGKRWSAYSVMYVCCKMKSQDFAMSTFFKKFRNSLLLCTCHSVYLDSTFGLSVLYHACHVYRGIEPHKNYASLSLIAFANSKGSDESVLKRSQFCYNLQSMETMYI